MMAPTRPTGVHQHRVRLTREPAAAGEARRQVRAVISAWRVPVDPDIAVLIIEHDMDVVFRFAKEITVLVQGAVFTQGTPGEIMANPEVRAVYLGQEGHKGGRHG